MPRKITTIPGVQNLPLPNGWNISDGDILVVSDATWKQILAQDRIAANVKDLGSTSDLPTNPPSWRDVQRKTPGLPVFVIGVGETAPPAGTPHPSVIFRET